MKRYDEADQKFGKSARSQDEVEALRAEVRAKQVKQRRRVAGGATGILATAALVVAGVPQAAVHEAGEQINTGAKEALVNVKMFGDVVKTNTESAVSTVTDTVASGVDRVLGSEQAMHDQNATNIGLTPERRESLGRQAQEAMNKTDAYREQRAQVEMATQLNSDQSK